jgi:hypothetical protein
MMNNEQYQKYLCSREWGLRREAVTQRSGGICERCRVNKARAVHHKTYERIYNELLTDLIHLCGACHDFQHGRSNVDPADKFSEIVNINENQLLLCPNCGGEYIHHMEITSYDRKEDDVHTLKTQIIGFDHPDNGPMDPIKEDFSSVVSNIVESSGENPSSRRSGLVVSFYCELCPALTELTIAQHKGLTQVQWRKKK